MMTAVNTQLALKQKKLDGIAAEIARCRICKKASSGLAVPGEGNPHARIVFIGEAPGKTEAKTGRPFVGRSGQLLRKMIKGTGLAEKDVFITSPVKYLPDRGTPDAKQIAHGFTHLRKQLAVIRPKIIVLLGNTAVRAILNRSSAILQEHGNIINRDGFTYVVTIHPAAVIRFPKYHTIMEDDFRKIAHMVQ